MAYMPRIVRTAYGQGVDCSVHAYPEEASQDFKKGALVVLDAGEVEIVKEGAYNHVFGIALEDASETTDTEIMVQRILPGDILSMHLTNDGTDATPVRTTHVGLIYGMIAHGTDTDVHTVDVNDTTDPWFRVVGIDAQRPANCVLVELMSDSVRGDNTADAAIGTDQ